MNKPALVQLAQRVHIVLYDEQPIHHVVRLLAECPAVSAGQLQQAYFALFGKDIKLLLRAQYKIKELDAFFDDKISISLRYLRYFIEADYKSKADILLLLLDQEEIDALIQQYYDWYDVDLRGLTTLGAFSQLWLHYQRSSYGDLKKVCQMLSTEVYARNEAFIVRLVSSFSKSDLETVNEFFGKMTYNQLDYLLAEQFDPLYYIALNSVINMPRAVARALAICYYKGFEDVAFVISVMHRDLSKQIIQDMRYNDQELAQMQCFYGELGRILGVIWTE